MLLSGMTGRKDGQFKIMNKPKVGNYGHTRHCYGYRKPNFGCSHSYSTKINKTLQAGNMKYIVSYSGGIGSAITAQMVVDKYGAENTVLLFSDTNMEDPDLYRFNKDVSNLLQVPITRIADGRTPWEVFEDVKFIGNSRIDPCSKILKREIIKKWIKENYTSEECNIFVGIDCSEEHRLHRVVEANKPYVYRSILIEQDIFIDNEYKLQWCEDNNITGR